MDLSREPHRGRGDEPSLAEDVEVRKRKYKWTAVILLIVLVAAFSGYVWFLKNRKREPELTGPEVVAGGRLAPRLSALLDRSYEYGWSRVEQELVPVGSGRWDPFRSLMPEPTQVVPCEPRAPIVLSPQLPDTAPEPKPPNVRLTGVLRSGDRTIALLSVEGRSVMTRVGDVPFYGAEVKSIDDKSITISFSGVDFTYRLGGEQK